MFTLRQMIQRVNDKVLLLRLKKEEVLLRRSLTSQLMNRLNSLSVTSYLAQDLLIATLSLSKQRSGEALSARITWILSGFSLSCTTEITTAMNFVKKATYYKRLSPRCSEALHRRISQYYSRPKSLDKASCRELSSLLLQANTDATFGPVLIKRPLKT